MSRDIQQMIPIALVTGLFIAGGGPLMLDVAIEVATGGSILAAGFGIGALLAKLPDAWRHARRLRRRLACAVTHHRWTYASQTLPGTPTLIQTRLACECCDEIHVFGVTIQAEVRGGGGFGGLPGNW